MYLQRRNLFAAPAVIKHAFKYERTSVVVVPATCVVVLKDLRRVPSLQQIVHLMLLPPGQRLAQYLPRFIHVEVSGPQETQDVLIFRDLKAVGKINK